MRVVRGDGDKSGDSGAGDIAYQLAGLEGELLAGLARLQATDGADDHVNWYRDHFYAEVRALHRALEAAGPLGAAVALHAWQVAFLARIWPLLKELRVRESVRTRLRPLNDSRRTEAQQQRRRCLSIAQTMTRPTAAAIRQTYATKFPKQPTPAPRTISRYLHDR